MKNTEALLRLLKCRFGTGRIYTGYENDSEVANTLKEYLDLYFNFNVEIQIKKKDIEIDLIRYIREELLIEIGVTDIYVSNPTTIEIRKELQGYTLSIRIRGLDHNKMIKLARLAGELIELQDTINYGEE